MTRHVVLSGHALDILARVPLWKDGLDYRHGTGHGVGSYLNVHEGVHYWAWGSCYFN
jgi:Xaa-Pro aminopeptidase